MEEKDLIILGAGNQSRSIADIVEDMACRGEIRYRTQGFLDDQLGLQGKEIAGYPVLGTIADGSRYVSSHFVSGIVSRANLARIPEIVKRVGATPERWATLIHPMAYVSRKAQLGHGVVVYPQVYVYGEAVIEDFVLLLPGAMIGTGVRIGVGSVVAGRAAIAAHVAIGRSVYVGQQSTVREHIRIGDRAVIGMGSVVVKDVAPDSTVVGNPARVLLPSTLNAKGRDGGC